MRFARWVFLVAGIYGLIVVTPQYFMEGVIARTTGPITHPEYFYGFIGVVVAFQLVFLAVARDPVRFRPIMPACVVEKLTFGVAAWALYAAQRVRADILIFAAIDLLLALLFMMAWTKTRDVPRG
ncbi:MAG TPA: hypothetical protein VF034_02855 [Gemmatimonadaceae bacterium]